MQRRSFKYKTREFKRSYREEQRQQNKTPSSYLEHFLKDRNISYIKNHELLIRNERATYDYFLPDCRVVIQLNLLPRITVKVKGWTGGHIRNTIVALNECKIIRFDNEEIYDVDLDDIIEKCTKIDIYGPVKDHIK